MSVGRVIPIGLKLESASFPQSILQISTLHKRLTKVPMSSGTCACGVILGLCGQPYLQGGVWLGRQMASANWRGISDVGLRLGLQNGANILIWDNSKLFIDCAPCILQVTLASEG